MFPNLEPVCSMSGFNCCFLTCIQILRRQVRWSDIPISWRIFQFVVIYTVKGFGVISKAEVDIFLEFLHFFYNPTDVGNLISGSSAFSKSNLNTWKFTVHILLKPGLENLEYYFASVWDDCNRVVVWTFFGIPFFSISSVAQTVKVSAYSAGDPGSILGQENLLEKAMATHSSILAWKITMRGVV